MDYFFTLLEILTDSLMCEKLESQNESTIKVPIPFKLKALYIFLGKNPNVVVLVLEVSHFEGFYVFVD